MARLHALIVGCFCAALLLACDADEGDCPTGHEQCPCTVEHTCLEGLVCLSNLCVEDSVDDGAATGNGSNATSNGSDSAAACQAFIDGLECSLPDGPALIDCGVYNDFTCDVAPYFDCLAEYTLCDAGEPIDASGWAECVDLAPTPEDCT